MSNFGKFIKEKVLNKKIKILVCIVLIWMFIFAIDYNMASNQKKPIFCFIHWNSYSTNRSEYYGIGYKATVVKMENVVEFGYKEVYITPWWKTATGESDWITIVGVRHTLDLSEKYYGKKYVRDMKKKIIKAEKEINNIQEDYKKSNEPILVNTEEKAENSNGKISDIKQKWYSDLAKIYFKENLSMKEKVCVQREMIEFYEDNYNKEIDSKVLDEVKAIMKEYTGKKEYVKYMGSLGWDAE